MVNINELKPGDKLIVNHADKYEYRGLYLKEGDVLTFANVYDDGFTNRSGSIQVKELFDFGLMEHNAPAHWFDLYDENNHTAKRFIDNNILSSERNDFNSKYGE